MKSNPLPLLFATVLAAGAAEAQEGVPIVLRDVSILTMESDTALTRHALIVDGEEIVWMGPSAELQVPPRASVIDGGGRFLLPGLADLHVHIQAIDLPLFLYNGITAVREMNGAPAHIALRDSIARGLRIGPRMVVTSALLAGDSQPWRHVLVPDEATARRVAHEANAHGFDALKVYDGLGAGAYTALADASRTLGLPLVGHIPREVGLEGVLRAGQRSIEHVEQITYATVGNSLDPGRIPAIAAQIAESKIWVVPTLAAQRILTQRRTAAYDARLAAPEMQFVGPDVLAWWKSLKAPEGTADAPSDDQHRQRAEAFYAFQRDLVRALHDAGVPLLVGTDTPNPLLVPGFSIHLELAALIDAGIPAIEVLRMATRDAACFLGEDGQWGIVKPGAAADLVLVDGDPRERIEVLETPVGVMVRGTWLDRENLDSVLERREAE